MTAIDTASPAIRRPGPATLLRRLVTRLAARQAAGDDSRARRAFVQEMTARNPDAFASDLDVQAMMQHYPGRF